MFKLIRLFIFVALLLNCAIPHRIHSYDQYSDAGIHPMIISDRVGESIDTLERRQFDLFPLINDFESAIIYQIGKDDPEYIKGYVVEITTADGRKYRSVNRDPHGIRILRDYVDDYDSLAVIFTELSDAAGHAYDNKVVNKTVKENLKIKYHIIDYDDDLGLPITSEEVKKYKEKKYSAIYSGGCGLGSCLLGFLAGGFVLFPEPAFEEEIPEFFDRLEKIMEVALCAEIVGLCVGYIYGTAVDLKKTIKIIKDGRNLKEID